MQLNLERLDALKATMMFEDDNFDFYEKGTNPKKAWTWFITPKEFMHMPPLTEAGDLSDDIKYFYKDEFLAEVAGKELVARIFLGREKGEEVHAEYEDWEKYAEQVGISKLITISAKIPEVIAKRFEYFANQNGNKSVKLRELIFNYVKKEWVNQADNLVIKESF